MGASGLLRVLQGGVSDPRLSNRLIDPRIPTQQIDPRMQNRLEYTNTQHLRDNQSRAAQMLALVDQRGAHQREQLNTKFDDFGGSMLGRLGGRGFMNSQTGIDSANKTVARDRRFALDNLEDSLLGQRIGAEGALSSATESLRRGSQRNVTTRSVISRPRQPAAGAGPTMANPSHVFYSSGTHPGFSAFGLSPDRQMLAVPQGSAPLKYTGGMLPGFWGGGLPSNRGLAGYV